MVGVPLYFHGLLLKFSVLPLPAVPLFMEEKASWVSKVIRTGLWKVPVSSNMNEDHWEDGGGRGPIVVTHWVRPLMGMSQELYATVTTQTQRSVCSFCLRSTNRMSKQDWLGQRPWWLPSLSNGFFLNLLVMAYHELGTCTKHPASVWPQNWVFAVMLLMMTYYCNDFQETSLTAQMPGRMTISSGLF